MDGLSAVAAPSTTRPSMARQARQRLAVRPREAARLLHISLTTTYQLMGSGQLPARKLGNATVIAMSDIEAPLASLPRFTPRRSQINAAD